MLAGVEEKCGSRFAEEIGRIRHEVNLFLKQKTLLAQPYTLTTDEPYKYRTIELDPTHTLKVIDQPLYDYAAEHGFPAGFFRDSYFDHVTLYCIPDWQDCSASTFYDCKFNVCRIHGADFENASFYSSAFHNCQMQDAIFSGASIVHTHFRDCTLEHISFRYARLRHCNTIDCGLSRVSFQCTTLDDCSYGRVTAYGIRGLHTATITQSGARVDECRANRAAILQALRPQEKQQMSQPAPRRNER